MKLRFADQTFSFELLRAASYGLSGGSEIGEVLATAKQIQEGDFDSWHRAWHDTASRIEALAEHSLHQKHCLSAGQAYLRASNYYRAAEFFLAPDDPRRNTTSEGSRTTFWKFLEASGLCVERVRITYEGTTLPGYLYRVDDSEMPRPTLLSVGGFDSTGEELVMLQDIRIALNPRWGSGLFSWAAAGDAAGLVVPGGVDGEVADELAGGGVDDPDVEVVDEHQNAGSGVGAADADVVQLAVDAQGEVP
ncbi:hypothetical protein [Mycolicibacterium chlorophenolicum]|uniref:Uncharacterized protein n=1 Tax=Mycolicibacterium chlorophenolicum TaxID=37916 RepID=A0A0J6VVB4_9MYCO|nr:hypothetical protein [Mycolicibacterium chlorophenolicum]KMO73438.1 hypothetical protein MCHLDSM_03784 [Mycolicibacterium chlorophenolicum]